MPTPLLLGSSALSLLPEKIQVYMAVPVEAVKVQLSKYLICHYSVSSSARSRASSTSKGGVSSGTGAGAGGAKASSGVVMP